MAGKAIARGAQDALSGKFGWRCTSLLVRDVLLSQEPLSVGPLGDAARTRPNDGQVSCSMATLLVMILLLLFLQKQSLAFAVYLFGIDTLPGGQQPSCFPGETAQAPFVFHGSRDESTFGAATLLDL
jgi:hypothetical protein